MSRTRGRKVALVIAAVLLALGAWLLVESRRHRQRFFEWVDAKPVDMTVDVSEPGEFVGAFHQTCSIAHGEEVFLQLAPERLEGLSQASLEAFEYRCEITDAAGEVIEAGDARKRLEGREYFAPGELPLLGIAPFEEGEYRFRLVVSEGISELAGVPQRVVGRYNLCGLELMPAFLLKCAGIVLIVIAGLILVMLAIAKRRGERPAQDEA